MNDLADILKHLAESFMRFPAYAVFVSCFVVGYSLKKIPWMPNYLIPAFLIFVWGGMGYWFVGDDHCADVTFHVRQALNYCFGNFIGFASWKTHQKGFKPYRDKIPFIGKFLNGDDSNPSHEFDRSKDGIALDGPKDSPQVDQKPKE
jgi:hypothetical protein